MARLPAPGYAFAPDPRRIGHQMRWLAAACDGMSLPRLAATGVTRGWRCLEIGTGGGSLARWLAERVAPDGEVIATDLRPPTEPPPAGLRYLVHDVVRDPLPEGEFDLIVSRLVLQHLPEREKVLARLAGALAPGGWLQIDEYDISTEAPLLLPDPEAERLYRHFLAAKDEALRAAGADPRWGREVAAAMRAVGLVEVDPRPHVELRTPETASLRLQIHHTHHLRERLVAAGMTEAEVTAVRELMCDPSFRACSSLFYSVHGRRPAG